MHLEEAGEKWRAGDAAKSLRFFMKAVENYETGLLFFPKSFDLAYNKYVYLSAVCVRAHFSQSSTSIWCGSTAPSVPTIANASDRVAETGSRIP